MLPKKRRISRTEIETVLKSGARHNSPHLLLYLYKNGLNYSKFSFSVSKKVAKTAVSRNKQRRRGYSIITKKGVSIKPGFSCLLVFKKGADLIKFESLEKEISELLYSVNVLV